MDDFYLLHRKSTAPLLPTEHTLVWSTCLRQIGFAREPFDHLQTGDETYSGSDAMGFLLEVICGLHSPLIGETEVQGQFRQFLRKHEGEDLFAAFSSVWKKVLTQSKCIRDRYLCGMGSQGYGSLVRQLIEATPRCSVISILGSGHLVAEVLPWIQECNQISIFARSVERAKSHLGEGCSIEDLNQFAKTPAQTVIIAAPLSDHELNDLFQKQAASFGSLELLLDLRGGDCELKGHVSVARFYDLKMCHQLLQKQMEHKQFQKEKALGAISFWKHQLEMEVQVRPFGWEDLCG